MNPLAQKPGVDVALAYFLLAAVEPVANDSTAFYTLIGVVTAALVTAIGGVMVSYINNRKKSVIPTPSSAGDQEVAFLTQTYNDARKDLENARSEIEDLQSQVRDRDTEVAEARLFCEYFMRELELRRKSEES